MKGCPNEPDFGTSKKKLFDFKNNYFHFILANLSALVYQHTISALALPIKLVLPTSDIAADYHPTNNHHQETKKVSIKELLEKGAGKIRKSIS